MSSSESEESGLFVALNSKAERADKDESEDKVEPEDVP